MKNHKVLLRLLSTLLLCVFIMSGCASAGETEQQLNGNEQGIPDELKGIKIYWVSTGNGSGVKVAVLNNKINSTTYSVGKTEESTIIIDKTSNRQITVSQVLSENDSVIVCRK